MLHIARNSYFIGTRNLTCTGALRASRRLENSVDTAGVGIEVYNGKCSLQIEFYSDQVASLDGFSVGS